MRHTQIAVLIASIFGASLSAHAAPVSVIQTINGTLAQTSVDVENTRMIRITGYAADLETYDTGVANAVLVKSVETGNVISIPILRRVAAPDALIAANPGENVASAAKLINAGFIAVVDAYTLRAGSYEVVGVTLSFPNIPGQIVANATTKGFFSIPEGRTATDIQLTSPDGEKIAVGLKTTSANDSKDPLLLASYPALRNGLYTLRATGWNKYGMPSRTESLLIRYTRPVIKTDISSPAVQDFPGLNRLVAISNPLDGSLLQGDLTAKAVLMGSSGGAATLQGVELKAYEEQSITLNAKTTGRHALAGSSTGSKTTARIWIDRPDAPDIEIGMGNWDPDVGIKLAANREAYAPTLDPVQISATGETGTNCTVIYGVMDSSNITGDYSTPVCAIRYKTVPDGLTQEVNMRGNLKGFLQADGDHPVAFETGVLWTNSETNETRFYRAKDRSITLMGIIPKEPEITFSPVDKLALLAKTSPGRLLTYAGQYTAGRVTVVGKYPNMTIRIKVGNAEPKVISGASTSFREFINTTVPKIWETQDVVIESWYNKYPDRKFTKTLTFTAIPKDPVMVLSNTESVSTNDTIISGNLGTFQGAGSGFRYDQNENGKWSVQLFDEDPRGKRVPIGDPVTVAAADGAFQVNLGKQPPSRKTLVAVATVADALEGVGTQKISSPRAFMFVKDGSVLTGKLEVRPKSGPVPFMPSLSVTLDTIQRVSDISRIEWFQSKDGTNYEKIEGQQNTGLRPQITDSGKIWYKVKLTNRHSELVNELEPIEVQAFGVPKVVISGETATFVGQPVVLKAVTEGMESDFVWHISKSSSDRSPQIVKDTDTITVTPTAASDMLIKVVASEKNAPADNPARTASSMTVLRARLPGVQKPMISGPRYLETGKEYEFKAMVPPLFSAGLTSSLVLKGRWVLPDGSTREGDTLKYVVNPGDKTLRYEAWVENVDDTLTYADFGLQSWTYAWPEWQVTTRVIDNRVPATLRYQVLPRNSRDLQKLGGERPNYTWKFPASFKVVEQNADTVMVEANEPGTFQVTATVSDKRGNSTELTSDRVEIAPAPDLIPEVTLVSGDRWNRAPNKLYARVNLLSVPKNDSFESATFKLNGTEMASGRGIVAYLDAQTPGTHEVTAVVRSVGGKVATASKTIDLGVGDNPICSLQQFGDGKTQLTLTAKCTVQQGFVASYKWEVNGKPMASTGYFISFAKADLDKGVNSVSVTATTDKGQQGNASWPNN